ncbi:hypothetical protein C1H46_012965 [Malus baccata]|uniref:Uncharacterized protein n=1 Tax=Malus baccata TaxID=106549 RepID=A0A540MRH4_MALBA|nr:hypothetical protein C1H46_012965 [Malus baccata]
MSLEIPKHGEKVPPPQGQLGHCTEWAKRRRTTCLSQPLQAKRAQTTLSLSPLRCPL